MTYLIIKTDDIFLGVCFWCWLHGTECTSAEGDYMVKGLSVPLLSSSSFTRLCDDRDHDEGDDIDRG